MLCKSAKFLHGRSFDITAADCLAVFASMMEVEPMEKMDRRPVEPGDYFHWQEAEYVM